MTRIANLFILCIAIVSSCKTNNSNKTTSGEKPRLTVEQVLANPVSLVEKELIVAGTVSHVCKMDGKKMFLFGANPDSTIRITTGPNLAAFDVTLEGNTVEIVGIVKELRIDDAYIARMEADLAKGTREMEPVGQEAAVGKNQNEELSNIAELKEQIKAGGKGYISDYWIEQVSMSKIDSIK